MVRDGKRKRERGVRRERIRDQSCRKEVVVISSQQVPWITSTKRKRGRGMMRRIEDTDVKDADQ